MNRRNFITKLLSVPVVATVGGLVVKSTSNASQVTRSEIFAVKKILDDQPIPRHVIDRGIWSKNFGKAMADQWNKELIETWEKEKWVTRNSQL